MFSCGFAWFARALGVRFDGVNGVNGVVMMIRYLRCLMRFRRETMGGRGRGAEG